MTVTVMEKLREYGWYLSEQGFELVSDCGNISDLQKLLKRAADHDLKEISSGEGDINKCDIVLQIQKLRNVAAPKSNEESKSAPRMLKLSLTDGKNTFQAIEVQHISSISLNTPPGTKLLMRAGVLPTSHGIVLLAPSYIKQVLGGKVANLVEKWELNKKLALHSRIRSVEEGGPPPWIPFGKKIVKVADQSKNFKSLAEKEKASKENAEFEAQRNDAIAEAAKHGSKKIFGGGNKQLLDHSVQKIVDQGFSIEQAEYALKVNRNNVDRALKSLQKHDNKPNREPREPREPKGKRQDKKMEESTGKPSSGKISLFDFLEDKLPAQLETVEATNITDFNNDRLQNTSDRYHSKNAEHSQPSRSSRGQRGNRGYQVPPRHLEEKSNKFSNSNSQYNQGNTHKSKPPRFQKSQESQNSFQQDSVNSYGKFSQNDFRNSTTLFNRADIGNPRDYGVFKANPQDYQGKSGNGRNQNHVEDNRNRQSFFGKQNRVQDAEYRMFQNEDRNYGKGLSNRYNSTSDEIKDFVGTNSQSSDGLYNENRSNDSTSSWVWKVGDICMAKYWEDNMYYNAEVTAVSKRTCVVKFKDFQNYEEVLQIDCIPITKGDLPQMQTENSRRQDQRSGNRIPRFEQGQNNSNAGTEFRRTGGAGQGSKGFKGKRGQHRGAQPIYQPPAQRSNASLAQNT